MSQLAPNPDVLDRAIGRAKRRLIPFMLLMYLLSYLDRANIGYAKQAFQVATGVSDAAFAFGAGAFFLTYALFEIPSNLILHRVGALPRPVAPEDAVDLSQVVMLEREGFFETLMGAKNAHPQTAA